MSLYGVNPALMATPGQAQVLFSAETPAAGSKSRQACLPPSHFGTPKAFSLEIDFAADPGAFSLSVQTSDTDADASYVTLSTITTGLNASFNTRTEIVNVVAKFVRVLLVTRTNAVALTVTLFTP